MKTPVFLILSCFCLSQPSCSSSGGGMSKGLLGAATGGLIGTLLGDNLLNRNNNNNNNASNANNASNSGNSRGNNEGFLDENTGLITGVVAGGLAGAVSDGMAKNEVRQKYLDGYNKGRSDAIKELYWVKRDAERPNGDSGMQRRYYEVPVPEHVTTDGVLVEPRKVVIEVVE
jgi:hypothetical protein